MDQATSISTTPPVLKSQDFSFLREEGMALLRTIASETWTDHNLHDPGVTLLEAFCYAITEMGLRSGMDVSDLFASDTSGHKQQFYTPGEILPVAPLTLTDFRKVLIDHTLVRNAWLFTLPPEPAGKLSALVEFSEDDLNSNTFNVSVNPPLLSQPYFVDVAFPYWDEEDVAAFREEVTLLNATFEGSSGNEWNPIAGTNSYFARIVVDFQPMVGPPQITTLWVVVQITSLLENQLTEVPLILQELTTLIGTLGDNSPADQTLIKRFSRRVAAADNAIKTIRRYLKDYRNLCELFSEFRAVRLQEIGVSAIIDVNPGVILENLLADIFFSIDQFISPNNSFKNLDELQKEGTSTTDIFDGPLLESGFLQASSMSDTVLQHVFYTSDFLRIILKLRDQTGTDIRQREDIKERNIVAVRNLQLANYIDNRPITTNARDCLHLVESQRHVPRLSLPKSRILFYRNGVEVTYDFELVMQIFEQKKAEQLLQEKKVVSDLELPVGISYPVGDYYPIQNDLPVVYGVGEAGLPDTATEERRALALQLKGYIFFFEQLTSGIAGNLSNINAYYSADNTINQTTFQQPLYHLPGIDGLLRAFDSRVETWNNFISNPDNQYVNALYRATENEDQYLSRRNSVLDHIMATFGEDMRDRAALEFRRASTVSGIGWALQDILKKQDQQRRQALYTLIQEKSAFIFDVPKLNKDRSQAYGNPAWRTSQVFKYNGSANGIRWMLCDEDELQIFQSVAFASSHVESLRLASEAFSLATHEDFYFIKSEAGLFRLELRASASSLPIAESTTTYATNILAMAAIAGMVEGVKRLWFAFALSPVEARLYHTLGIRMKRRRILLHPVSEYFEIYDEPIPNPDFEKRFRLWSLPGFGGDILLESENNYPGTSDGDAVANTSAEITVMINYGIVHQNYRIDNPSPGVFESLLLDSNASVVARVPGTFPTYALATASIERIVSHLYDYYSNEGFYMIEHSLLFPNSTSDDSLVIEDVKDPFSFQVSFVFPSGYARDFSDPESPRQPMQSENYRDPEFRRYAELQVRKACPAHILPRILWVDRAMESTPVSSTDPSFDNFEQCYNRWANAWFTELTQEATMAPLRNDLVNTLNNIYDELI